MPEEKMEREAADRVFRVRARAVVVLGNSRKAVDWMSTPLRIFGDRTPVAIVVESPEGEANVLQMLRILEKQRCGALHDSVKVGDDFVEPLPDSEISVWEGSEQSENPIEVSRRPLASARRIGIALTEATRVFGSSQQALEWMGEQILALHGQSPADVAGASEEGLVRVLRVIGRIDFGVYE